MVNEHINDLNFKITESAVAYFEKLLTLEPKGTNLKVVIHDPGTIYADLKITFCLPGKEQLSDIAVKLGQVTIFIEEKLLPYLRDAKIDYLSNEATEPLSVNAPYLKKSIINDNQPLAEKIQAVIDYEINPLLGMHGGIISLVKVVEDTTVLLRFGGGCRGCQMANITFQQTVEHMLRLHFPELKEIRNVTDELDDSII